MDIEQMQTFLDSLQDFFRLTPHTADFAKLDILQDITTDPEGGTLPAGRYLVDADSNIYAVDDEDQETPLPFTAHRLTLLKSATGTLKFANLIFYIGEYMKIPAKANALLDNYFPQDPLLSAMQEIVLPDEIVQPLDRVTRKFFANELKPNKSITVQSGTIPGKQDGKKIETVIAPIVTVSLLDLPPGIELSRNIELMDNAVFTHACSLFEAGNKHFTGHDIYRSMTGNPNAIASPEKLQEIDDSWTRLTSTAMKLDTGNMGDAYHFARWVRSRRIIEGGKDTVIVKNQYGLFEATVYTMNEEPTLKTYSDALGQVGRYPAAILNTPVNKTTEIIILQNALLQHIQDIPKISNHIVYDTLFSKININAPTANAERQKKAKLRKQIGKILDHWTKCGLIDGWRELKQGTTIYCIEIDKPTRAKLPGKTPKKAGMPPQKNSNDPPKKQ